LPQPELSHSASSIAGVVEASSEFRGWRSGGDGNLMNCEIAKVAAEQESKCPVCPKPHLLLWTKADA